MVIVCVYVGRGVHGDCVCVCVCVCVCMHTCMQTSYSGFSYKVVTLLSVHPSLFPSIYSSTIACPSAHLSICPIKSTKFWFVTIPNNMTLKVCHLDQNGVLQIRQSCDIPVFSSPAAVGGRGVPLSHQTHDEGGTYWRLFCLAPGLWVCRQIHTYTNFRSFPL